MYKYGAEFVGSDISENQLKQARRLSKESGMEIEYVLTSAEDAAFPNESFDVVTACQCFQYFDKNIALPNIHRMLKDGGLFCILFMAPLPKECDLYKCSEELVLKHNPLWTGGGITRHTPAGTPPWAQGLFEVANIVTFDENITFTRDAWHGRMMTCRGVSASDISAEETAAFGKEHYEYMQTLPETFEILHFITILNLQKT
jgi:SAM-dependent methyltransferase